jgi:uncharacterized membrane protein YdbT with pleckstrin-like domain
VGWLLAEIRGVVLFGFHLTLGTDGFANFIRTLAFWASLALMVVGVVWVGYSYILWWVEDFAVTNQKVVKVSGLLSKRTSGSGLEKINDVVMEQGPLGRILGYGTLKVATASDTTDLDFRTMRAPADFRRAMLDQKLVFEQADAVQISNAVRAAAAQPPAPPVAAPVAPPAPVEATAEEKLRSLAGMRDSGLITAEDYEAKKSELLADL